MVRNNAAHNVDLSQQVQKYYYDKKHQQQEFHEWQLVLIRSHAVPYGISKKLAYKWVGPYIVLKLIGGRDNPRALLVASMNDLTKKRVSFHDAKPYYPREDPDELDKDIINKYEQLMSASLPPDPDSIITSQGAGHVRDGDAEERLTGQSDEPLRYSSQDEIQSLIPTLHVDDTSPTPPRTSTRYGTLDAHDESGLNTNCDHETQRLLPTPDVDAISLAPPVEPSTRYGTLDAHDEPRLDNNVNHDNTTSSVDPSSSNGTHEDHNERAATNRVPEDANAPSFVYPSSSNGTHEDHNERALTNQLPENQTRVNPTITKRWPTLREMHRPPPIPSDLSPRVDVNNPDRTSVLPTLANASGPPLERVNEANVSILQASHDDEDASGRYTLSLDRPDTMAYQASNSCGDTNKSVINDVIANPNASRTSPPNVIDSRTCQTIGDNEEFQQVNISIVGNEESSQVLHDTLPTANDVPTATSTPQLDQTRPRRNVRIPRRFLD